ncbi:FKBP-type peptidyl-prolyl cis-trans isomerase [Mucilaginibacter phyllosphaerae]|nr:FKBP-type peptidyl-prolyl cis-trans isomerase [Mucilaginibacter phyllosphaerae]MBB3969736.1 FKBP-type peptidyl-prolyl cis-trans isomerase [Mucilaginibacter phyllosphaerae]
MKNILFTSLTFCLFAVNANAQFTTTAKGAQYQIISTNPGAKLKMNDIITFNATQSTDKDSVLFSTYSAGQPIKTQIRASNNIADLMDIFPLLSVNDSAIVKVPVDSVFKGHETEMPPIFKKGGSIVFKLKVLKVQTLDEAMAERNAALGKAKAEAGKLKLAETATMAAYLKKNNITATTTPSGLKYIVKSVGAKPKPLNGDTVYVNYTGQTLDGKMFDSSIEADAKAGGIFQAGRPYEPIDFVLGSNRVIKGWEEGLSLLNEGSKARFIIPSDLAYGENASGPVIKPFSTLVFDVELVKVGRIKHAAVKPAAKAPLKKKTAVKKRTATKKKN